MPILLVISFSAEAISSACARLSSAQGPAISAIGRVLPKDARPTLTIGFGTVRSVTEFSLGRCSAPGPDVRHLREIVIPHQVAKAQLRIVPTLARKKILDPRIS